MANTSILKSFEILDASRYAPIPWPVAESYAGQAGDDVYLDSAGRAIATAGVILGIQQGFPRDVSAGGMTIVDTANSGTCSADDLVSIYNEPGILFTGLLSSFALADPYTTRSSAACYDGAGSAGARYVDAAASSNDVFKVAAIWNELGTGNESVVGANAKCVFQFNALKHYLGVIA